MCDETKGWLNEKDQALSTDDCGKDLASVQALQRRHQVIQYFRLSYPFIMKFSSVVYNNLCK